MRKRIFEIIEVSESDDKLSKAYDIFMILIIVVSLIPLMFKHQTTPMYVIDKVCVIIFIIDYILRLCTADFKLKKNGSSFIRYPFTPMAIIDLLSILPSVIPISQSFKVFRLFRMVRAFRVFRVFRGLRYSKNLHRIITVLKKSKDSLLAVGTLAIAYILITALIIFNVEPDAFKNFFEAMYWSTVSLTTVGYGDLYAVSTVGRIITMVSSIFGIAIVALPAGIITAGYMKVLEDEQKTTDLNR